MSALVEILVAVAAACLFVLVAFIVAAFRWERRNEKWGVTP